jgi:hypothetical protein
MGLVMKEDTVHDTDEQLGNDATDRPMHWIERLCASAWVRVL